MNTISLKAAAGPHARRMLLSACMLLAPSALEGCGRTLATSPPGSQVSANDLRFLATFYNVVEFDKQVVGSELSHSADPRVSSLARDLLDQAVAYEARIEPFVRRDGITLPDTTVFYRPSDLHDRIAAITGKSGYDFDQEFLRDEISMHDQAIARGDLMMGEAAGDPAFRAAAVDAMTSLRRNRDRLAALDNQLLAER